MSIITGVFIGNNSFTGKYKLARAPLTDQELQSFVIAWEKKYIRKLLGVELGNLLITYKEAQPNSNPPDERLDDIIAEFDVQETSFGSCGPSIYTSLGIADLLTALVYFHYVSETQLKHSQSGITKTETEVSNVLSPRAAMRSAEAKWNNALETADAIQWFCRWKSDPTTGESIYPEYRGIAFSPQYGSMI